MSCHLSALQLDSVALQLASTDSIPLVKGHMILVFFPYDYIIHYPLWQIYYITYMHTACQVWQPLT